MHTDSWTTYKGIKHTTKVFDSVSEAKKTLGEKETLEFINRAYRLAQLLETRKKIIQDSASA